MIIIRWISLKVNKRMRKKLRIINKLDTCLRRKPSEILFIRGYNLRRNLIFMLKILNPVIML